MKQSKCRTIGNYHHICGLLRRLKAPRNDVADAAIKNVTLHQDGRVGNGQKPEQRLPKSRTKWVETQGGARSVTERLPSVGRHSPP